MILHFCLKMPTPSQKELKSTKIGKIINKLAKALHVDEQMKGLAMEIVNKWKKDLSSAKKQPDLV